MNNPKDKELMNQKFKEFLLRKIPYANLLTPEELAELKTAFERNEEAKEDWNKAMQAAINTISKNVPNREALLNDADFYIQNFDQTKYQLNSLIEEYNNEYGYVQTEDAPSQKR